MRLGRETLTMWALKAVLWARPRQSAATAGNGLKRYRDIKLDGQELKNAFKQKSSSTS